MQQGDIAAEMERARVDFHCLLDNATSAELRAGTDGTKWTNEQLLFHMLFGYLLVQNMLILVRAFTRLPRRVSKAFAATLNAATRPFHVVNYLGSLGGARVLGHARMERLMDFVIGRLQRSVIAASEEGLDRGMHFPVGWDPYFNDYMTLRDVYHYATQHYDHHRRQLTLASLTTVERFIGYPSPQAARNSAGPAAGELPKRRLLGRPRMMGPSRVFSSNLSLATVCPRVPRSPLAPHRGASAVKSGQSFAVTASLWRLATSTSKTHASR
jgi:DinB superfamily